jgi:hypothetical protein
MWGVLRVIFGVALVLLILVLVVSPYVDLPLATLRARQIAHRILGLFITCWTALAALAGQVFRLSGRYRTRRENAPGYAGRDLLGLNCALLC